MTLIPGRTCGDCTVCCTVMAIDKPDIQKPSGAACRHCVGGCTIYETRPEVCRSWYCGWRTVDIFSEAWRPDKSGVMPQIIVDDIPPSFNFSTGIGLLLVGNPNKIVRQKWFQDFVTTGIMNSIPLFLSLPGPRGHKAATILLNTDQMAAAIDRGRIKDALEEELKSLRRWEFEPAVITHKGNDVSLPEG